MENEVTFKPTFIQLSSISGIVLIFVWEVLKHYTHWEQRTCFVLAALPVLTILDLFADVPLRRKVKRAIGTLAIVAIIYVSWGIWPAVWR
jgi:hypothetical protein